MKLLLLTKYPSMAASSRLRSFQFVPLWTKAGHQVEVSAFFNEHYLRSIYSGKLPNIRNVLTCYFRRFRILLSARKYDIVWIEKEAFPFLPSYAEWLLNMLGKGYVVDYDDAVFHNYDQHRYWLVRTWMGDKIDWVMRHSLLVTAGNNYLQARAQRAGAKSIQLLPTVIDLNRYRTKELSKNSPLSIGWIGSPTTLRYVRLLLPVLEKLYTDQHFQLILVNGDQGIGFSGTQVLIPWTEEGEVEAILKMDIGIMPLIDDNWERGKCAYKLIQYMACGIPVVASPVGMNTEVVSHGENGFLADSEVEWVDFLQKLLTEPELRKEMGTKGRKLIEEQYNLEKNFEKMEKAVRRLMG